MEHKTVSVGKMPVLIIDKVPGDLRITGWDRDEIKAKTNGSMLELVAKGETVTLTCDNDLIVSLPKNTQIEITSVEGDASLRVLTNSLTLTKIGGDLALRNIGQAAIGQVEGDLVVRHATDALKVDFIAGDASVRDVIGDVALSNVGSDLHLRNVQGNINAKVGGDAIFFVQPQNEASYKLESGADILLRLPNSADVEMELSAADDLTVILPDVEDSDENPRTLTLGAGSAKMNISAGADLHVTTRSDDWADMADFDISLPFIGADFPGLPDDFAERISHKMDTFPDDFADRISQKVDKAARKMDEKMRKAEHKVRHAERQVRQSERHVRGMEHRDTHFSWVNKQRRTPPTDPVSDDERLMILQMLQEKKISADDAEKLLSALEQ